MPINYANYPADWKAISLRIRERDEHKCKWCGVPNLTWILRDDDKDTFTTFTKCERIEADYWLAWDEDEDGDICSEMETFGDKNHPIRVVLTVAHIDHDTANNADDNLAALCQRCHLRHDAHQHAANAARTRAQTKRVTLAANGQQEMGL